MKIRYLIPLPVLAALLFLSVGRSAESSTTSSARIERGRYLVQNVGMCADCHTPRDEKGELIASRSLMGSTLTFQPTVPMPNWAPAAPQIAGLPTMTVAQAAQFLQTGKRPDGTTPRPPMPAFRLNSEDAAAVAAYLKSLAN